MRILGLITARGGSKRLPNKNIKLLGGKPLVSWTLEAAIAYGKLADIVVSTDSLEIARVCNEYGNYAPWLRPKFLSSDISTSVDVAIHALDIYELENDPVDALMLLQPTSPFRTEKNISDSVDLFRKSRAQSIVGVSPIKHSHPSWAVKIKDNQIFPYVDNWKEFGTRSQDLMPAYYVNGCMYIIKTETLRNERSFVVRGSTPYIIESEQEAIDIDDEWDWNISEFILTKNRE